MCIRDSTHTHTSMLTLQYRAFAFLIFLNKKYYFCKTPIQQTFDGSILLSTYSCIWAVIDCLHFGSFYTFQPHLQRQSSTESRSNGWQDECRGITILHLNVIILMMASGCVAEMCRINQNVCN